MRLLAWAAPVFFASSFQIPKRNFYPFKKADASLPLSSKKDPIGIYKIKLYGEIASKAS